ncbi:MAG: transaldolase family protein [Polyangiaceae bacterium]
MLFLDSSDPREIADIQRWGVTAGITTNPLIFAREGGGELEPRIRQILEVSTGPVSVELVTEGFDAMLEEALRYSSWDTRICIKVPFSEAGLCVQSRLRSAGIATNMTCIMSFNQAYLAALGGATYVSLFSGRVRDMGYEVRPIIEQIRAQLDREKLSSQLLIGSIRHLMDVNEALQSGAHIVTVPPPILRKMLWNPRTDETIREFNEAWARRS